MIIIARKDITYGGAELLIERVALEMIKRRDFGFILTNRISDTMKNRFENANIPYVLIDWYSVRDIKKALKNIENPQILTVWVHDYLYLDIIRSCFKTIKFGLLHYVVTGDDLVIGKSIGNKIIKNYFFNYYKKHIVESNKNNEIIYMDPYCRQYAENYYDIQLISTTYFNNPYDSDDLNIEFIKKKAKIRNSKFEILSISRAELEMKGYLVTLLSKFPLFHKKHQNASLTIISFGPDEHKLKEIYDTFDEETQKYVHLIGQTKYEDLKSYFNKASVYVGMGTTLLDAANHGLCVIPVLPYTQAFVSEGTFDNIPDQTASFHKEKCFDAYSIIDQILCLNDTDYYNKCILTHDLLREHYNISKIGRYINSYHDKRNTSDWNLVDLIIEVGFLHKNDKKVNRLFENKL